MANYIVLEFWSYNGGEETAYIHRFETKEKVAAFLQEHKHVTTQVCIPVQVKTSVEIIIPLVEDACTQVEASPYGSRAKVREREKKTPSWENFDNISVNDDDDGCKS